MEFVMADVAADDYLSEQRADTLRRRSATSWGLSSFPSGPDRKTHLKKQGSDFDMNCLVGLTKLSSKPL